MNISKSIKIGLAKKEVNQGWLASKLGTGKTYVSAICKGASGVSTDRLQDIANIFDVPVSEFIRWGE